MRRLFRNLGAGYVKWRRRRHPRKSFAVELRALVARHDLRDRVDVRHDWGGYYSGSSFTLVQIAEPHEDPTPLSPAFVSDLEAVTKRWWPKSCFRVSEQPVTRAEILNYHPFIETCAD